MASIRYHHFRAFRMNFRRTIKLVHQLTGVTRPFPAVHGCAKGARIEGKEDKVHRAFFHPLFHPLHLLVFLHLPPFILEYWTNHIHPVENGENSIQNSIHRDFLSIRPSRFLTPTNKQNNREESAARWMDDEPRSIFVILSSIVCTFERDNGV